ncbi:hypothetical protein L210DRAFT_246500 [Boletus edulis BED1]|uniref:Uncharacterized protein n=1 Tax=Boletus edulis BED1 TaxID=1328754 RepID=A0AAD4BRW2_BOLED|nr:hypothetical protein L210DRAFT_246500 [Boletus edulis BED1]
MGAASKFRSIQANVRLLKHYRSKITKTITETIQFPFDNCYESYQRDPDAEKAGPIGGIFVMKSRCPREHSSATYFLRPSTSCCCPRRSGMYLTMLASCLLRLRIVLGSYRRYDPQHHLNFLPSHHGFRYFQAGLPRHQG